MTRFVIHGVTYLFCVSIQPAATFGGGALAAMVPAHREGAVVDAHSMNASIDQQTRRVFCNCVHLSEQRRRAFVQYLFVNKE